MWAALFSVLAGYFGMKVATRANVRTANAARTGGINEALRVAFSGGTVMGMCVVGLGLIGASVLYIITKNSDVLTASPLAHRALRCLPAWAAAYTPRLPT